LHDAFSATRADTGDGRLQAEPTGCSLRRQATSNPGFNRFLDEVMSFVCGILQCGEHSVRDFASRGLAAQIRAMIGFVRQDCLDAA
jgi:hypothetical protein